MYGTKQCTVCPVHTGPLKEVPLKAPQNTPQSIVIINKPIKQDKIYGMYVSKQLHIPELQKQDKIYKFCLKNMFIIKTKSRPLPPEKGYKCHFLRGMNLVQPTQRKMVWPSELLALSDYVPTM